MRRAPAAGTLFFVETFEPDAIHALLVGVMNANAKLDEVLYILGGDDDEEEEEEADG